MSSHNTIVITSPPRGVYLEGVIASGETPKPGTMMQIKASTSKLQGRFTFEAYNQTNDGDRTTVMVLVEDMAQGKTVDDAYAAGDTCRCYCPLMGEELQVLLQNQSGTGEDFAIGDKLIVDDTTGKFLETTGSPESEPFICTEAKSALTADTLCSAMYTGH